ncbi:MAG TPA: penicillin-binding protein 2 [Gaiellaceae bacterium]|nr:penicillin-binding protein 2 [Gaiellaceae bacterium]
MAVPAPLRAPDSERALRLLQPPPPFERPLFTDLEPGFRRSPAFALRLAILAIVAVSAFAALGLRLWSLQVLQGDRYAQIARAQAVRVLLLPGLRGPIVDSRGRLLAGIDGRTVVTADPVTLGARHGPAGDWRPSRRGRRVLARLAQLAGSSPAALARRIRAGQSKAPLLPAVVLPEPSRALTFFLAERAAAFPGIAIATIPERFYPAGPPGSAFLGLLGEIDARQLHEPRYRGYRPGDVIGRSGVEARYDRLLRSPPELVRRVVDALGVPLGPPRARPPRPPHGLQLTIDLRLQRAAERALRDGIAFAHAAGHTDAEAGAAVVLDPRDGSLLALASYPSFDQARAARDPRYLARLLRDPSQPLLNRATQGLYPTGSTFKPIVAEAALAAGLITPETILPCTGSLTVGTTVFHNVEPAIDEPMNLRQALAISCDTWFYRLGELLYRRQLERHRLDMQSWALRLGLGHPTGIDLPGEAHGIVPTPAWLRQTFRDPWARSWYEGTSINLSIGQGSLAVSPLQLAVAYAALANGGTIVRPHLARAVLDEHEHVTRRLRFPPRAHLRLVDAGAIRAGLYSAAHDPGGTSAGVFADFPVPVAGKTGTAEMPTGSDTSWYASWAPAGRPRAVVVVMIEHGGFGADAAAPAARELYRALFHPR